MAAGTAVIATATDGARELLDNPETLVPIKNPLALAAKIVSYLDEPDRTAELGRRLADTAREGFGLEKMVDATEALYRKL